MLNELSLIIDIDECSAASPYCDQVCVNTVGGYKCTCNDGFLLNTTTRNSCYGKYLYLKCI